MANHKSAKKRIRQTEKRRLHNRYYARTMRNALSKFRDLENKEDAAKELPKLTAMIDRLSKRSIIHKNKASNLKSKLAKQVNAL